MVVQLQFNHIFRSNWVWYQIVIETKNILLNVKLDMHVAAGIISQQTTDTINIDDQLYLTQTKQLQKFGM